MKSLQWIVRSSLAVLLVATSAGWAQGGPSGETCGQVVNANGDTETSVSACMGQLLTAQGDMISAVEDVVNEVQAMNLPSFGTGRYSLRLRVMDEDLTAKIQSLRDEHGRASAANEAAEEADYENAFEKADQEKGKKCRLSDIPFKESLEGSDPPGLRDPDPAKFGDGKCNVFEAIVDIPGAPDDGEIVHVNERRENMCEMVCEDRVNPSAPSILGKAKPRKEERKERVVGRLTDGIDATLRATERISEAKATLSALRYQLSSANVQSSGKTDDICVSGSDPSEGFAIAATAVSIANSLVSFVTIIAETAKDSVEPPANQTVAGFNVGSAVIPFAVVAGISKIAEEILSAVEKGLLLTGQILSANRVDTIEECLRSVRDDAVLLKGEFEGPDGAIFLLQADVDDLQVKAGETATELATIKAELALVKGLLEYTRDLLLMPQGKRDGFNKP